MIFVTHYTIAQRFGGREEGGWWYHITAPIACRRFRKRRKARRYLAQLKAKLIKEEIYWRYDTCFIGQAGARRQYDPNCGEWPVDAYGQGPWAAIEKSPREHADTAKAHYE